MARSQKRPRKPSKASSHIQQTPLPKRYGMQDTSSLEAVQRLLAQAQSTLDEINLTSAVADYSFGLRGEFWIAAISLKGDSLPVLCDELFSTCDQVHEYVVAKLASRGLYMKLQNKRMKPHNKRGYVVRDNNTGVGKGRAWIWKVWS